MRKGGGTVRRETMSPDPGRVELQSRTFDAGCIVNDNGRILVPRRRSRASQLGEEKIVDKFYNLFIFFIKYRQQIETKMKKQGIKLYLDFNSLRNSAAFRFKFREDFRNGV